MVRRVVKRMLQRRETIQVELQALVARQGRRGRGIVRDHVLVIACEPQDPLDESEAEGLRVGATRPREARLTEQLAERATGRDRGGTPTVPFDQAVVAIMAVEVLTLDSSCFPEGQVLLVGPAARHFVAWKQRQRLRASLGRRGLAPLVELV